MKRKISMILVLVLVIGTLLPSMAFAAPYKNKNLNMEQYELKSFHSRLFNDLPWGLFKRGEGNLPPGLAKKAELPHGLTKEFHADNFELYVNKMIIKYNCEGTEGLIEEIERLLEEDSIENEEVIRGLIEDLKEMCLWDQFIDRVELIIDKCGEVDTSITVQIEALMDDPENKEDIEDLIEELEELCDAYEYYEDLIGDINDIIGDPEFEWPDEDTGDSFMATFEDWNDIDVPDPDPEVLLEAIGVLEALLDYLDDMFTIEEGIAVLEEYKDDMDDILEDTEFTTGASFGAYLVVVETTFDEYIEEIEDLTDPSLFDIIVLISEVELFLETYEDMRYITTDEYDDYVDMRDEVLVDLVDEIADLDDDELDLLYEEFVILTDELDDEDFITLTQYEDFIDLYDELMELYDELME
ncbi:MAG: hypothetical protein U9Q80_08725 [Bacillota bacterium]|nr:hypothetical protein [Bacillota bacterium]